MANKSVLYRKDIEPPQYKNESISDTLTVFGEKSKVADNITESLKRSFLSILSGGVQNLISKGEVTRKDIQNIPFNIGTELGGGYGVNLGLNVPSEVGKQDYQLTFSKQFKEGGKVNLYNELLKEVATKADMKTGEVENLMSKIAYRESKGVPTQKQISSHPKVSEEGWASIYPEEEGKTYSGPGRGLYQYEIGSMGGSGAGRTALNRLANIIGEENLPKWTSQYFGEEGLKRDVDFSELTEEQQNILFLADKLQDPMEGNIAAMKTMGAGEWWKKFHHKGKASKEEEKKLIKGFMEDIAYAEKTKGAKWTE